MDIENKELCALIGGFFLIFLSICLIACLPFAQIWALNTLFKLNIEYNLINWFAVVILNLLWCRFPTSS